MALQNLRSSTANKRPVATSLSDGQIAINTNAASPGIFFKNSSNVLTKVGPIQIGTSAPNSSPAGSAGNAVGEQWLDTSGSTVVLKVWDGSAWQQQNKFSAVAGTAAAPSLAFDGDPDSGLFSPGANQVAVATNGTERLAIEADGDIRIGSTADYGWIRGWSATTGDMIIGADQSATGTGGSNLIFRNRGSERLRITSAGLVGIGTSSPSEALHVKSTSGTQLVLERDGTTTQIASVVFKDGSGDQNRISSSDSNLIFESGAGNTERLRIDSSGKVGIGTTSPNEILDVRGKLYLNNGSASYFDAASSGGLIITNPTAVRWEVNSSERARIDSSGRLLVGTSSSSEVNTAVFQGNSAAGSAANVTISSTLNNPTSTQTLGVLSFSDNSHVKAAQIECLRDGGTWTSGTSQPSALKFSTTANGASSPTARMTIKEDGVVAINAGDSPNGDILFASCDSSRAAGFRVGPTAGTYAAVTFYDGINTDCGSIDIDTTANTTAYTTSSDYRLKSNVQPLTGNLQRLAQLKPCKWEWLSAPEVSGEGFLAHEAQEVVPGAVTGTKDEVDENGNPVYQGIDQSKLIPLLTAALQEAIGEIESLKARLTAAGI